MRILTIGFTKKSAREFFSKLQDAKVETLVDVRLNNVSQLAGFTKKEDLPYFLEKIVGIDYRHEPALAPTHDILDALKKHKGAWADYEKAFLELMKTRSIETRLSPTQFDSACLLCSEELPHHCHRRLVAEYLKEKWGDVNIEHIT